MVLRQKSLLNYQDYLDWFHLWYFHLWYVRLWFSFDLEEKVVSLLALERHPFDVLTNFGVSL